MIQGHTSNPKAALDRLGRPNGLGLSTDASDQISSRRRPHGLASHDSIRILYLSSAFPPHRGSEAFCAGKMALALKSCGANVSVFCMEEPHYAANHDASSFWRALIPDTFPVTHHAQLDRMRAVLLALRYHTVAWPRWVSDVVKFATQLHRHTAFNIVYSRSPSLCNQIAGYWLAKKLKLPWIVNINDPWDYHLFPDSSNASDSSLQARVSSFWLKRTLTAADVVTYPCHRLAKFTSRLANFAPPTEIVPHIGQAALTPSKTDSFRLVHAGKLGTNEITGRSTRALLLGLRKFLDSDGAASSKTELVLVGSEDPKTTAAIEELDLKANVTNVGQVTYEESLDYIASASACLLIEGPMHEGIYLPSKLADYIVARKPIIALSPSVGTIADMAFEASLIRVDRDNEIQIAGAIKKLYDLYQAETLATKAPSDRLVSHFTAETISRQFLNLVADVMARSQRALS